MKIRFLTRELGVCRLMAEKLIQDGEECVVEADSMGFYENLLSEDFDLLVCDYRIFQLSIFNLYDFLKKRSIVIPLVFYNDPFPERESRVAYWIMQNERLYDCADLEYLIPIFEKLHRVIEDPAVHPYISLLQPPLPLPGEEESSGTAGRQIDLRLFRRRNKLQPGLFKLFQIFYENQQKELSLKELSRLMWGTSSKTSTVYSYISRLRKRIEKDYLVSIELLRTAPGRYEMTVY